MNSRVDFHSRDSAYDRGTDLECPFMARNVLNLDSEGVALGSYGAALRAAPPIPVSAFRFSLSAFPPCLATAKLLAWRVMICFPCRD